MVDAIVSIVLQELASISRQQIQQEFTLVHGVSKEIERLTSNFQAIQAVLVDAELRQVKEATVRLWLDKLKAVSYDAENVLDKWNTSKLKLQIERVGSALSLRKKVCSFFLSPCFSFKQVVLHRDIALKIKEVNETLDAIAREKDRYHFTNGSVEYPQRVESISFIEQSDVYGRDKEKDILVSKLSCESSDEIRGLHIISLVGMGGIGKTTLAQLVYNDDEIKKNFEKRIWVCVSDPFDVLRVAKAIAVALEWPASDLVNLESCVQRIHQSLREKKFLLILDDVWTEDYDEWKPLHHCLRNGLRGSRILVTTRKQEVAHMMESIDVIPIKELSEEHCWLLFKSLAFSGRSKLEHRELEDVGKEIVSKCKGLPLATKSMGSLLRFKKTSNEWKTILDSEVWKLEEFEKDIFRPLMLSYHNLPPIVKRCFSYCAIFPKDYHLDKWELIELWMAQGYLELEGNEDMEMIGEKYFNILATHSFFQEFMKNDIGDIKGCKMHDIVHDFAQFLTKNECFALIEKDFGESSINISFEKAHHLMLMVDENSSFPISISNFKKLRSLVFKFDDDMHSIDGILLNLLAKNTCLRALTLSGITKFDMMSGTKHVPAVRIEELPKEIGKLMHLRYLDLSYNLELEMLPETLCELYNLQTLNIFDCEKLKELPQGIGKLINLRHLVNDFTSSLRYMPKGLENLTCLRTLTEFHVSEGNYGNKVSSLECLNRFHHLEGTLKIKGLGNMTNESEAHIIELENKTNIVHLEFDFSGSNSIDNEALLEALQPPSNLKGLTISTYAGDAMLPNWMVLLTNLRRLILLEWIKCEQLPSLGKLSSLESLVIRGMKRVKRVGNEVLGLESDDITSSSSITAFPNLKSLWFWDMEEWEEWDFGIELYNIKVMPSLQFLEIQRSPKLKNGIEREQERTGLTSLTSLISKLITNTCKEMGIDIYKDASNSRYLIKFQIESSKSFRFSIQPLFKGDQIIVPRCIEEKGLCITRRDLLDLEDI